jgi:hypothetical protein
VLLTIESSIQVEKVHYFVVDRTGKWKTGHKNVNSKSFQLPFFAETWMVPEVHVLVFFFHNAGEIIYDTETINFNETFSNKVNISIAMVVKEDDLRIFNLNIFTAFHQIKQAKGGTSK